MRAVWVAVVLAASAVGCAHLGDSDERTGVVESSSVPSSPGADDGSDTSSVAPDASEAPDSGSETVSWERTRVPIVTGGMETKTGEPGVATVRVIGSSSVGFVAAGQYAGGLAIWVSDDFGEFVPLYNEVCCTRHVFPTAVAEFDGTLLVAGNGREGRTDREFGVLLRSDDGGATWTDAVLPAFSQAAERIDSVVVVGDSVLVELVDEATSVPYDARVFRSSDLVVWEEIELPGIRQGEWPGIVADQGTVFATAYRSATASSEATTLVWSSTDAGRTFVQRSALSGPLSGLDRVVVDGAMVVVPSQYHLDPADTEAAGLAVLEPDRDWVTLEPDVGQFGDGHTRLIEPAQTAAGPTYAVLGREVRASAHYCYEDAESCRQLQSVLVAATEPTQWHDVADLSLPPYWRPQGIATSPDGLIALWATAADQSALDVYRWSNEQPPRLVDPPGYPPPSRPIELFKRGEPLRVGHDYRYVLALGHCGGMYINDSRWAPETPLPDPPPASWPYLRQRPGVADGPDGYVFGRISMTSADSITFSIEDTGNVATYRPAPPLEEICG